MLFNFIISTRLIIYLFFFYLVHIHRLKYVNEDREKAGRKYTHDNNHRHLET